MEKLEEVTAPKFLLGNIEVVQQEDLALNKILNGETICRFEWGNSMSPILVNGQYACLTPFSSFTLRHPQIGDAVFCKVHEQLMTHMIWNKNETTGYCLIGSTSGELYGWTKDIYALATPMPYKEKEF